MLTSAEAYRSHFHDFDLRRRARRADQSKRRRTSALQRLEQRTVLDGGGFNPIDLFVAAAYQQVLVREVDTVSLTAVSSALQQGAINNLAFTETLTHSVEYYSSVVSADYAQFLGRAPDGAGLAFWDSMLGDGMTNAQVASQFIGAQEFFNACGGTNQAWVNRMYFDLLGRAPDAAGEAAWTNVLNAGTARSLVAFDFANCPERQAVTIGHDYHTFLGRQASVQEVDSCLAAFAGGMTDEDLIGSLVGSNEFFNDCAASAGLGTSGTASSGSGNIVINIGTVNINIINSGNTINNSGVMINSGNNGPGGPAPHGPKDDHHGGPHHDD